MDIKSALEQLIGVEFTKTTRTGTTECIMFGILCKKDHKGIEQQVDEFEIHLQCPWRITKGNIVLVGSDDVVEQPDETAEYDKNFNWNIQGGNLRDVKMKALLNSGKYVVKSARADNFGGFELLFNKNLKLSVFSALSRRGSEYWWLVDNKHEDAENNHFIVGLSGIDE